MRLAAYSVVALVTAFVACKAEVTNGLTPPARVPPVTGPKEIRPISGNNQAGPVSTLLPLPIVARVYDSTGIPVPGVPVTWNVDKGGRLIPEGAATDSDGNARAGWFLGDTAGSQQAIVSSPVGDALFSSTASRVLGQVLLQPALVTLLSGNTQQFTVLGVFTDGTTGTIPVTYSVVPITGGLITSAGLFTAGNNLGSVSVIATQVGGARLADTSIVNVVSGIDSLQRISLTPRAPKLLIGSTLQFSVTGLMTDGSTVVPPVTYTASGGTIGSSSGLFVPPATTGKFLITATQVGGSMFDTTTVTVSPAPVPDPNEPVYTAGVSRLVYQDGFDSYHQPVDGSGTPNQATFPTTARMETNGTYSADPTVYMSASIDVGRSGSGHSLRSNNTLGTEGGSPQSGGVNWHGPVGSGVTLPAQRAKHVFQYWFKTNPGGGPNLSYGMKFFEWWANGSVANPAGDIRYQAGIKYGQAYGGTFYVIDTKNNMKDTYSPVGPFWNQLNDGNWHRITIAYQGPSGVATRDGYIRVWVDGTKVEDIEQATVGVTPPGGWKPWVSQADVDAMPSFQLGYFQCWPEHVNGADANWTLWVDDFIWWTEP